MYKVKYKLLFNNIQRFFYSNEDSSYNTRQRDKLKKIKVSTALRAKRFLSLLLSFGRAYVLH